MRRVWTHWQFYVLLVLVLAGLGAASAWLQDIEGVKKLAHEPEKVLAQNSSGPANSLLPDGFSGLPSFVFSVDGPLGTSDEAIIRRTRRLVRYDRSNVDCQVMKCIALTFDDGPSSKLTPELINILRERSAVATFFVLGLEVQSRKSILRQIDESNCEIGNHTYSHRDLTDLSKKELKGDIGRADDLIFKAAGVKPRLIRPPMGRYNAKVENAVDRPLAMWSIDPRDWRDRQSSKIYKHIIREAKPGRVVVAHDIYETTVRAMPRTIDELQKQGYVLVTMSELFDITDENYSQFAGKVLRSR